MVSTCLCCNLNQNNADFSDYVMKDQHKQRTCSRTSLLCKMEPIFTFHRHIFQRYAPQSENTKTTRDN